MQRIVQRMMLIGVIFLSASYCVYAQWSPAVYGNNYKVAGGSPSQKRLVTS